MGERGQQGRLSGTGVAGDRGRGRGSALYSVDELSEFGTFDLLAIREGGWPGKEFRGCSRQLVPLDGPFVSFRFWIDSDSFRRNGPWREVAKRGGPIPTQPRIGKRPLLQQLE